MGNLVKRLRIKAGMIEMGELIAWGSDSALMREAADALEMAGPAMQGEPVAWIRKWSLDGDKPTKERNKNGRMAYPMKYKLHEVTRNKHLHDDVALYASPQPAEQKSTACVGCEGAPASGNSPCAVCGQKSAQPAPDVAALVEALERIKSMDSMSYHCLEPAKVVARTALAAYRKGDTP